MVTTFGALTGKLLTLRRQVPFGTTPRPCGSNFLEEGRHLPFWKNSASQFPDLSCHRVVDREGNGNPLQYSCLENPIDRRSWWAAVHGVSKSWTQLSDFTFTFHIHSLKKKMASHSSVLAWRIPGTLEPGGLLSMGSHGVGHD